MFFRVKISESSSLIGYWPERQIQMPDTMPQAGELFIDSLNREIYRVVCADENHVWVNVLDLKNHRYFSSRHYGAKNFFNKALRLDEECFKRDFRRDRVIIIEQFCNKIVNF